MTDVLGGSHARIISVDGFISIREDEEITKSLSWNIIRLILDTAFISAVILGNMLLEGCGLVGINIFGALLL